MLNNWGDNKWILDAALAPLEKLQILHHQLLPPLNWTYIGTLPNLLYEEGLLFLLELQTASSNSRSQTLWRNLWNTSLQICWTPCTFWLFARYSLSIPVCLFMAWTRLVQVEFTPWSSCLEFTFALSFIGLLLTSKVNIERCLIAHFQKIVNSWTVNNWRHH